MSKTPADGLGQGSQPATVQPGERMAEAAQYAFDLVRWFDPQLRYAVALSGGVDSAVVAAAAARSSAPVVAVTARSAAVSQQEIIDVAAVVSAGGVAIEHHFVDSREVDDPSYRRNDALRCYYCKSQLFQTIRQHFPDAIVLTGTNSDDLGDYRPGLQAAAEAHVQSPLVELGYGKREVRAVAAYWNLPVAHKPASPCLASRIAHGIEVTPTRLTMIESAESVLRALGLREFRVRLHADELARIEVPADAIEWLADPVRRQHITTALRQLGFRFVALDLDGFRSGSLNPILPQLPAARSTT